MPVWWIPAVAKGTKTLADFGINWYGQQKQKRAQRKYLSYLNNVAENGTFSPAARDNIIGRASASTGNAAQNETADIRGRLEANGMGDSISGIRMLSEPGLQRMRTLGDVSADIESQNELSKANAREEYARAKYGFDTGNATTSAKTLGDFTGGVMDTGMTALNGYGQAESRSQHDDIMKQIDAAIQSGDNERAKNLISFLLAQDGGY